MALRSGPLAWPTPTPTLSTLSSPGDATRLRASSWTSCLQACLTRSRWNRWAPSPRNFSAPACHTTAFSCVREAHLRVTASIEAIAFDRPSRRSYTRQCCSGQRNRRRTTACPWPRSLQARPPSASPTLFPPSRPPRPAMAWLAATCLSTAPALLINSTLRTMIVSGLLCFQPEHPVPALKAFPLWSGYYKGAYPPKE